MRILLDTHIYLWWLEDKEQLSREARKLITDAEEVFISSISLWEAAIKIKIKKLDVELKQLIEQIPRNGFNELPLLNTHIEALTELSNFHRDPFDQMLIAQAITEPLILLTSDAKLQPYSDLVRLV